MTSAPDFKDSAEVGTRFNVIQARCREDYKLISVENLILMRQMAGTRCTLVKGVLGTALVSWFVGLKSPFALLLKLGTTTMFALKSWSPTFS